jgi:hypothetical protein
MKRRRVKPAGPEERFLLMPEWILVHECWRSPFSRCPRHPYRYLHALEWRKQAAVRHY